MKLSGIDGVIVDWYGFAPYLDYGLNNQAAAKLFEFTRKAGPKFPVCYENQTIKHMIDGNYLAPSNALPNPQPVMLYLPANFFSPPTYFPLNINPPPLNSDPHH